MSLVVALVNGCDLVREGLRVVLARQPVEAELVEVARPKDLRTAVDLALYDPDAPIARGDDPRVLPALASSAAVAHPVAFSPSFDAQSVDAALAGGAHGVVSSRIGGAQIADALVRVADGEVVVALPPASAGALPPGSDWPGRAHGVTAREGEILLLAAQGLSNPEIARLLFLSPETVKSYMSSVFTKMGFRNRVEATAYVLRTSAELVGGARTAARPKGKRPGPGSNGDEPTPTAV